MRKRFFLLLALATALLLAFGMSTAMATTASPDDGHAHWAWCTEPTVCAACGAAYDGDDIRHNPDSIEFWQSGNNHSWECLDCGYGVYDEEHTLTHAKDEEYHWYVCAVCGEVLGGKFAHYAYCSNPTVCCQCGAPYSGDVIHSDERERKYDETEHWEVCTRCGEEMPWSRGEHIAHCGTDVCYICGQPYFGDNIMHDNREYQYNETEHWCICAVCGQETYRHEHFAYCDMPGVCGDCRQPYSGDVIIHPGDYQIGHNETEHWLFCSNCGEEQDWEEHYSRCDNPGECAYCGQPYSGDNVVHTFAEWVSDGQFHWNECPGCGEITDKAEHTSRCDNPTVCTVCGATCAGDNLEHNWYGYFRDAVFHWKLCAWCDAETDVGIHYVNCDNQDNVCVVCGAECENPVVYHNYAEEYSVDETYHWRKCDSCGKEQTWEAHYAYCDTPGVCAVCGYEKEGLPIFHDQDTSNFTIDQNYHTSECRRCGQKFIEQHYVSCADPGFCKVCGAAVSGVAVQHTYRDLKFDENEHWFTCVNCGREIRIEHTRICTGDNKCVSCGQPYAGSNVIHYYDETVGYQYQHDETNHWSVCTECGDKYDIEAHTYGDDGVCTVCEYSKPAVTDAPTAAPTETPTEVPTEVPTEQPTTAPTDVPTTAPTDAPTEQPTEVPTEAPTVTPAVKPTEKPTEEPTEVPAEKPTEVPTTAPTDEPTEAPTEAPTAVPTEKPTAAPTEKPTEQPTTEPTAAPTDAPTDTPHEHVWTVTAKTPATCEKEGVTAYSCACGETKLETVKALGHNFAEFVSQGDGTHRSDCTRCGTFTVQPCELQSRTVNGIPCQVCGICGYTVASALTAIELPEAPMADATAVTETGEAASILVFDVTASLPEDSAFALCLRVMPQGGETLPGSVRITIPCTLDTTGLRLIFIPEGGLPVEVPYSVGGGMITFTVTAPGIFALVPVQE